MADPMRDLLEGRNPRPKERPKGMGDGTKVKENVTVSLQNKKDKREVNEIEK